MDQAYEIFLRFHLLPLLLINACLKIFYFVSKSIFRKYSRDTNIGKLYLNPRVYNTNILDIRKSTFYFSINL